MNIYVEMQKAVLMCAFFLLMSIIVHVNRYESLSVLIRNVPFPPLLCLLNSKSKRKLGYTNCEVGPLHQES